MTLLERKTETAIRLMKAALPVPLDLAVFLLSHGIDVAELERQHRE